MEKKKVGRFKKKLFRILLIIIGSLLLIKIYNWQEARRNRETLKKREKFISEQLSSARKETPTPSPTPEFGEWRKGKEFYDPYFRLKIENFPGLKEIRYIKYDKERRKIDGVVVFDSGKELYFNLISQEDFPDDLKFKKLKIPDQELISFLKDNEFDCFYPLPASAACYIEDYKKDCDESTSNIVSIECGNLIEWNKFLTKNNLVYYQLKYQINILGNLDSKTYLKRLYQDLQASPPFFYLVDLTDENENISKFLIVKTSLFESSFNYHAEILGLINDYFKKIDEKE